VSTTELASNNKNDYREKILKFFLLIGRYYYLLKEITAATFSRPFYLNRLIDQLVSLGVGSIPITIVIGITMGAVMTLNFGHGLAKFGGILYVPSVVSISLVREMAPIFTSLLVAGRIGSGISAEIGSMNVTQQIDAIRALGSSPIRVLVVPRVLASMISLPLLTILAGILGIFGGLLICNFEFSISPGFYFNKVISSIKLIDLSSGILKSIIFGFFISTIACFKGLTTRHGTRGVGKTTTWVVVTASIIILISDFFLSKIFLIVGDLL
jgi:phospholipid/cholesterol/gamma-HCH transport system permease protein